MEWWRRLPTSRKVLVGAGGAAVLYLAFRWYKAKKSGGSSTSGGAVLQPTSGPAPVTPPTATVTLPGGASYSGPAQGLGDVLGALQQPSATTGTATTTPATPAPAPSAPSTPGYGTINIGGQDYAILGRASSLGQDYQVGGGAPVFFGNGNGVSQGAAAEAAAARNGGYAYVPVGYQGLISSAPGAAAPGQPGYKG